MSRYYRYLFIKKYYPNYIIFIKYKKYIITYNNDLKIIKLFNYKELNINYMIIDNISIIENKVYSDNKYFYYFKIIILLTFISNKKS